MYETEQEIEKVILVAVCSNPNQDPEESLDELEELVKTAGATVVGRMIQNLETQAVQPISVQVRLKN